MYNLRLIQEGLKNVVGFRNSPDPQFGKIDSDLTASETGIYFQSVHPLVNLDNLFSICQNVKEFVFDPYNSGTVYSLGDKVSSGSINYESLVNVNNQPVSNDAAWKIKTKQSLFSDYLRNLRDDAIHKVFARVVEAKKLRSEVKDVMENLDLYQGIGRADDTIIKSGRFVFYQIHVKKPSQLTVAVSSITTQFNTAQGALTIYVYSDNTYEPQTVEINLLKAMSPEKTPITVTLQPGINYIGYYEDDLVGQALRKKDYYWNSPPCGSCNQYNSMAYGKWSQYVTIKPGYVAAENLPSYTTPDDFTLWDLSKNVYQYDTNWGLNFGLTVGCDITDFIITNRDMFGHPISMQLAVDVLNEMAYNLQRANVINEGARKLAMYNLDSKENYNSLPIQLSNAIKAMDFDLSGFSECMPCKKSMGIKVSAI
jgi:hypothetical protein